MRENQLVLFFNQRARGEQKWKEKQLVLVFIKERVDFVHCPPQISMLRDGEDAATAKDVEVYDSKPVPAPATLVAHPPNDAPN